METQDQSTAAADIAKDIEYQWLTVVDDVYGKAIKGTLIINMDPKSLYYFCWQAALKHVAREAHEHQVHKTPQGVKLICRLGAMGAEIERQLKLHSRENPFVAAVVRPSVWARVRRAFRWGR